MDYKKFGALLRKIRLNSGMTITEFGMIIGYSESSIQEVEDGRRIPAKAYLRAVSDKMNIPIELLENHEGNEQKILAKVNSKKQKNAGERVHELRTEMNMTLKKFGQYIHSSPETVRKIEQEITPLTKKQAQRISEACHVGTEWLLYGDESMKLYPVDDEMILFLKRHPEVRKEIYTMMLKK
jgi:transcriptional regulator with XRE-family HTH domain